MALLGNNSMVPQIVNFMVANSIICFLALSVVGFRIYGRITTKAGLGWDDGFILVSITTGLASLVVEGLLCTSGIGHPIQELNVNPLFLIKIITINNALFIITTIAYKLSVLSFYLRIFWSDSKTRISAFVFMAFFVLWGIICFVDLFALCRPHADNLASKTCDRNAAMQQTSAVCIFGDFIVLVLPLPAIWKLKMSRCNKAKLTFLFLLGFIVTIVAIARCISIVRQDFNSIEFTLTFQEPLAYAVLEPNMGILCASLPMVHNQVSAWKTSLFNSFNSRPEHRSKSFQLENEQAVLNHRNAPIFTGDSRYGYTVSITAGKRVDTRTRQSP